MAVKKDISLVKQGMQKDKHPSQLEQQEYVSAVNANLSNESGNFVNISNEHSNILSSKFKNGFKVVGFKNDINSNNTYFFLTNPLTKISEFGYITNTQNLQNLSDIQTQCNTCDFDNILSQPLENITQVPSQIYTTLLSDCESNKCFNLSILHPIKKIEIKTEKDFKSIYFTDNFNPPRYIQLNNLEIYSYEGEEVCGDDSEVINTCLACEKMSMFRKFGIPNISPDKIVLGGRLLPGEYEFLIAYTDALGNEISDYFSITNPISIFDKNNIVNPGNTRTNFAIKLNVSGLDKSYSYYKVAVIQTNTFQETSYFEEGIHTINDNTILYTTEQGKIRTDLSALFKSNVQVQNWEGITQSNGYIFGYGITKAKEINLQPVVSLMGSFVRWQTHIAKENLYEDGISNSLYKSYHRDEAYPLSIRFLLDGGYITASMPFIGREATSEDRELLPVNTDTESLGYINNSCVGTTIAETWQVYNTASVIGACDVDFETPTTTIIEESIKTCYVNDIAIAPKSEFVISLSAGEAYTNLFDFIKENKENCGTYPFCSYLNPSQYSEICTPNFNNCSTPELLSQDIEVESVENEIVEKIERDFPSEYAKLKKPQFCSLYKIDNATGLIQKDEAFMKRYMPFVVTPMSTIEWDDVYTRQYTFTNEDCVYAVDLPITDNPNLDFTPYFNNYKGANTLAELQTTRTSLKTQGDFYNKVSKSALWFKGYISDREKFILEISKQQDPEQNDDISIGQNVRLDIFNSCSSSSAVFSDIINLIEGVQYYITVTDTGFDIKNSVTSVITSVNTVFNGGEFFISIDIPTVSNQAIANPDNPNAEISVLRWHTSPVDGCYTLVTRNIEYKEVKVQYDSISFRKKMIYKAECSFEVPQVQDCIALPYQYGKFGFVESTEEYPDNKELYDSSKLVIKKGDIPSQFQQEFEEYFVNNEVEGVYVLDSEKTNYACKKIRHFKFPDNKVAPFMWENQQAPFADSIIYPLGITIDENIINAFLDIALKNNLISPEQRKSITGYEIMRGDRTLDKGVVAKGLMFDMMKYQENGRDIHYSNYPFNDLGSDKLNLTPGRASEIPHPFGGLKNNNFTFHSPETDYNKIGLPSILKVEGYMYGASKGFFDEVRNHPRWTILGRDAKRLANTLAIAEVAAEIAIEAAQAASNAQVWIVGGLGSTGASVGLPAFIASGVILALGIAEGIISKAGRYRYQWLETFRNLGTPRNFAYYYTGEGMYNYMQTSQEKGEMVRTMQVAKNIRPGRLYVTNEVEGSRLEVNNTDREESVLISFGEDFPITYPEYYRNYDNGSVDFNSSSRTYESESNACKAGRSSEIRKNVASMYVSLKNYLPSQYSTLGSVKWLTTGYRGNLKKPKASCASIFGGDVFITRHTLRRKMPVFATTAMGQASLTPFEYKYYSNIGTEPRFYCDYEIDGGSDLSGTFYPDIDSDYSFDCLAGDRDFYVKAPSKFYLYYNGIPNFLTETEINTNYRTSGEEPWNSFYPFAGDMMEWTQEEEVSIKRRNNFLYNSVYSKNVTPNTSRTLPDIFSRESFDKKYDSPNGVMYSLPDNSENDSYDPWLIYRPLDFYEFPTDYGKLVELRGIETTQVLGRFENQTAIFNAVDILVDGITPEQKNLGNGGIFARRPVTFSQTDLGYAGSQTTAMVSCEYGHFFADAKRGHVFFVQPGGKGIEEISKNVQGKPSGMSNWFKEHLPFKILKSIPNADIDNPYNRIGITMGWDSRYKRIFLTKRDYIVKGNCLEYDETLGFVYNATKCGQEPIKTCPEGYAYNTELDICEKQIITNKCELPYIYNPDTGKCEKDSTNCDENGLDIVFILDATSSQSASIQGIKDAITTSIVPSIIEEFGSDYRLGLISVKDRRNIGQALFDILTPMTIGNESQFLADITTIVATGGGGLPEPTDLALKATLNNTTEVDFNGNEIPGSLSVGSFRPNSSKAIILVTDSTPSGFSDSYSFADWLEVDALSIQSAAQGIQIFSYLTANSQPFPSPPLEGVIPPNVTYLMQNYANRTGGMYYFSRNGEGIGDNVVDAILNNIQCKDVVDATDCSSCVDDGDVCICFDSVPPIINNVLIPVDLEDTTLFEDVSFTIAYSPFYGSWVSYYDFKPNYYVSHHNYFQTGMNGSGNEFGIWSHLLTNKSFQVFYGKKYDFSVDYPIKSDPVTKKLNAVQLWTEAKRNHNDYDYAISPELTFNKTMIYNTVVNSGAINLIPQKNNFAFNKQYPKNNPNNTQDILISNIDNFKWSYDYMFNRVKSNLANQPNLLWDKNQISKTVNPKAVTFGGKRVLQRLYGDYFINQLSYNKDSRYSLTLKWIVNDTQV